ncbi:MAG: PQQ-dependent sugar dehydrogenase [Solirubrobacterales bacterium]|nr:PQQ-dependent sugar dehydrogenase [Solirubrobacterales bacterium]
MRTILAGVVALVCWFGITGSAFGLGLVRVTPPGFLNADASFLTAPPDDDRVFIAERGNPASDVARIMVLDDGAPVATPFLSISGVDTFSERGLMSFAFAPDYATSGRFYVFYIATGPDSLDPTGEQGDIRIVEYRVSAANPDVADPASARLVLSVPHSAGNHNGGWMAFGPDDLLYFTIGDNADSANAQSLANLYGKVSRIDPADPPGAAAYSIPAGNPFASTPGARDEIFAYGLRNPYRASFAPDGRLTIGDVGEGTWEEIDAGDLKGKNLGWPHCEGFCSPPNPAYTDPVYAFGHNGGENCAVVGGHVVEDPDLTGLTGRYLFSDYCNGQIRSLDLDAPGGDPRSTELNTYSNVVAFGQDSRGCSYVLTPAEVYRIVGDESSDGAACPIPPKPPVDVTYRSFIPNRAVIARRVFVSAQCSIACSATAKATVRISRNRHRRRPATFRIKAAATQLQADRRGALALLIPARRIRPMRMAVRNGSRIVARVTVTMTGADSSGGSGSKTTRLVRPKRR